MLRRRDAEQGRIDFVDIASPDYSPHDNAGITYEQVRHPALCWGSIIRSHDNLPDPAVLRRPWATYMPSRALVRSSPTWRCALLIRLLAGLHARSSSTQLVHVRAGVQTPL